ncbi:MAG: Rrf2 family transcriptional regulator [Ekhidna sp.]
MFSKSCEYGIRAVTFIATHAGQCVGIKSIVKSVDSPESFTSKILQQLVRAKIISSMKGPNGGFYIEEAQTKKISLLHIVDAIDGDNVFNGCGLGLKACNSKKPCPMHHEFENVRNDLKEMLIRTTLNDLIDSLKKGESFLKR